MDTREAGRLGGKSSLTKMSKEARIARAKKASLAAAEKRKKPVDSGNFSAKPE